LGTPNNLGITIYDGGQSGAAVCPASTSNIFCTAAFGFFNGYHLIGGFTIGNTYFVRLWTGGAQNFASFDFCVQEVPPPPVNDNCENATEISLTSSALACSNPIIINTSGATPSPDRPGCLSANEDDVWFKFTATGSKIRLIYSDFQQLLGTPNNIGFAFYKSTCPTGSATFICNINFGFFNGKTILEGFEPGATYYFRTWSSGSENFASFSFCLQAVIPPPNDECNTAINLEVGAGFCTKAVVTNMFDATTSAGFNNSPSCRGATRTEDVWYTAIVPSTGNLMVETSPANASVNDLVMVAFTGNCGSLSQLECNDNGNPETGAASNHPRLVFTGRTPGEKITFRIVSVSENGMGRFSVCAWDTSFSVLPPIAPAGVCTPMDTLFLSDSLANGYRWLPVFDPSGNIVAEIFPNSSQSDTVYTNLFVSTSGNVRMVDGKYYADRNLSVSNSSMHLNGKIRMYIQTSEINALRHVDSTVAGISNLDVKSDTGQCIQQIKKITYNYLSAWSSYKEGFGMQINTGTLGNYFATGSCGPSMYWTGSISTDWHNPLNWGCGGVPSILSTAFIPAGAPRYPLITQSTEIKELIVQPTASVHIQTGVVLKVNGISQ
jgi:hypothetical protein